MNSDTDTNENLLPLTGYIHDIKKNEKEIKRASFSFLFQTKKETIRIISFEMSLYEECLSYQKNKKQACRISKYSQTDSLFSHYKDLCLTRASRIEDAWPTFKRQGNPRNVDIAGITRHLLFRRIMLKRFLVGDIRNDFHRSFDPERPNLVKVQAVSCINAKKSIRLVCLQDGACALTKGNFYQLKNVRVTSDHHALVLEADEKSILTELKVSKVKWKAKLVPEFPWYFQIRIKKMSVTLIKNDKCPFNRKHKVERRGSKCFCLNGDGEIHCDEFYMKLHSRDAGKNIFMLFDNTLNKIVEDNPAWFDNQSFEDLRENHNDIKFHLSSLKDVTWTVRKGKGTVCDITPNDEQNTPSDEEKKKKKKKTGVCLNLKNTNAKQKGQVAAHTTDSFYYEKQDESYPMNQNCRGLACIINIQFRGYSSERHGSDIDKDNLEKLFDELHFEIVDFQELLKKKGLMSCVETFSRDQRHQSAQAAVLFIMSHGSDEMIDDLDDTPVPIQDIYMCLNEHIPQECPKLLFLQACRNYQDGEIVVNLSREVTVTPNLFIGYATDAGQSASRDQQYGAHYAQAIINVFSNMAATKHLHELMTEVCRRIDSISKDTGVPQTATFHSKLTKLLYFNPGKQF